MSLTRFLSQGVYDKPIPISLSAKAYLAGFQCCELTSGEVATPASPIAPARESGAILKNGTPVVMVFAPVVEVWLCALTN